MSKKSLYFYNDSQIAEMEKAIEKGNQKLFAKTKAEEWSRPATAIRGKMRLMEKAIPGKKDMKHYTDEQLGQLKHSIFRGDSNIEIVNRFAKKWNRGKPGLYAKILDIKRKMVIPEDERPATVAKGKTMQQIEVAPQQDAEVTVINKGIELPKGFKFEGTPSKVVLFSDHFKVYF